MKAYPVHHAVLPNGENLAYRQAGSAGPTVVLIHGNMSSSVHWQTTMEALEGEFRLVAPDLRGFGDSSYEARFDSLLDLAHDVEAFLDAVGVGPCAVVGWSTGGGVALELAADRPDQVTSTVLVDSVPPTGYPIFRKDPLGQPIMTELLKTKEEIAADPVQVLPVLEAYRTGARAVMRATWDALIYNLRQPSPEDYELYLDAIMKQRNLVDVDFALLTFNMTDSATLSAPGSGRLERVRGPVTVIHGEKDLVVPFAWAEKTITLLGDRAKTVTFPDAGHSPITDVPEAFVTALKEAVQ
ncbi:MAG: alpha/beta hydrolase [Propionibacteriaceae bacterium]|jgi:pimeloyl-ACP methyl ester carboxylesterase|nr:alpha/beta hydrolase [Propionibacteriaceae bacterium]